MQPSPVLAYLGLGSNCLEAEAMIAQACMALAAVPTLSIRAASPLYVTEPQGFADQPWFVNQVLEVALDPQVTALDLLNQILSIEAALGRTRSADPALRFGPRVIDIDILLYNDVVSEDLRCILPHPRMTERAFVLIPLLDIAPRICINGKPAAEALAALPHRLEGHRIFQ